MRRLAAYGVMLVVMVAIEAVMLPLLILPMFQAAVPQLLAAEPDYLAAAMFYLLYPAGLVHFATGPALDRDSLVWAARDGGLFGLFCYLTYEATNMATLAGWSWSLVFPDIAWGMVLSAIVAAAGYLAGSRVPVRS